jgi:hypothetical protein
VKSVYPKWVYHKTKEAQIVRSDEELALLGDGWVNSRAEARQMSERPQKTGVRKKKRTLTKE